MKTLTTLEASSSPREVSPAGSVGALIVGGQHPGLGVARSLGRRRIPVCVVDDEHSISAYSRYVSHFVRVKDLRDERRAVDAVLDVGYKLGLRNWVLFPTRDETVAAFSRCRTELARFFKVTTPEWDSIEWAWNKKKTYDLAGELSIPCPLTFNPKGPSDLDALQSYLPLAIKPAVKEHFFYATKSKAWRADNMQELHEKYAKARLYIASEEILLQEIIPGDGTRQFSYCAFFRDGRALGTLVARRLRQHPPDFGRAATYVESIDLPQIEELAIRFLEAIDYYGIVEVEFKQDPRDGKYKLLDVNARTWGFHSLGFPAGVDFPYLLFSDQLGQVNAVQRGEPGIAWLRLCADVPASFVELIRGRLDLKAYFASLLKTRIESVYCAEDPLPALMEFALLPYFVARRYF